MEEPNPFKIAENISIYLKEEKTVLASALVGSAINKKSSNCRNIDLIALLERGAPKDKIVSSLVPDSSKSLKKEGKKVYQLHVKDPDEINVILSLFFKKQFKKKLEKITNGVNTALSYKNWALGFFVPEGFCGDISEAFVFFDRENIIKTWKERLENYPKKLKKGIIESSLPALRVRKNLFMKAIDKEDKLAVQTAFSDSIFLIARLLFAFNEEYFQGLFGAMKKIREFNKIQRGRERLQSLLSLKEGGIFKNKDSITDIITKLISRMKENANL